MSIARNKGAVLVLYDAQGKPQPGWPIEVPRSTWCDVPGFSNDGSLRAVCDATDLPSDGSGPADMRAFAFDTGGRVLGGWPVQVPQGYPIRVVGDDLMLLSEETLVAEWDGRDPNQPLMRNWLTRISADGTATVGEPAYATAADCRYVDWAIGPDGVAYGVSQTSIPPGACLRDDFERARKSIGPAQLKGLGMAGAEPGWPISIDGAVSHPEFAADGMVLVAAGPYDRPITRIYRIDPRTHRIVATSPKLPIVSATSGIDLDCGGSGPPTPFAIADGTVLLNSYAGIWAFSPDLQPLPAWPRELPADLVYAESPYLDGLTCGGGVAPVVGPDGTLYLSLEPASKSRGGRLDGIAKDGKRPAGWPVKLTRAGSKFWDVAVGEDGTIYALAVEPEGNRTASATLLAIDPDSEVRYAVTLLEP